ncbi:MAG: P1 family peptidase, partial [Oscillospiraceae bacterium]
MKLIKPADYGITVGSLTKGKRNQISDVAGVTVGHCTLDTAAHKTGVTVLLPVKENPFTHKLPAGVWVMNGFGKTLGLVQIEELGTLESPIAFTNTLNVGRVHDGLVEYLCRRCEAEGVPLTSVNPIVCECNDATLNDIRHRVVTEEHVFAAIESATADFDEGDVGGGKGTVCHDLKGGMGSASRLMTVDGKTFTMGALVQTNHGCLADLTIGGQNIGKKLAEDLGERTPDQGSVIVVLATDLPLDARQLRRVAR